eukprot:m51a1_g10718 putative poly -binding protein ii-like (227) ;mRNA; r:223904-225051
MASEQMADQMEDYDQAPVEQAEIAEADPNKPDASAAAAAPAADQGEADLEAIKKKLQSAEGSEGTEESDKMQELMSQADKIAGAQASAAPSKEEVDERSVFVGNVHFGATQEEVTQHFQGCGQIIRVTVMTDKFTGAAKGFAYIEFGDKDAAQAALMLNESVLHGRQIKVMPKRTNVPGRGHSRGRGRGFGMGPFMMSPFMMNPYMMGMPFRGRGRGGRGRGFSPY